MGSLIGTSERWIVINSDGRTINWTEHKTRGKSISNFMAGHGNFYRIKHSVVGANRWAWWRDRVGFKCIKIEVQYHYHKKETT